MSSPLNVRLQCQFWTLVSQSVDSSLFERSAQYSRAVLYHTGAAELVTARQEGYSAQLHCHSPPPSLHAHDGSKAQINTRARGYKETREASSTPSSPSLLSLFHRLVSSLHLPLPSMLSFVSWTKPGKLPLFFTALSVAACVAAGPAASPPSPPVARATPPPDPRGLPLRARDATVTRNSGEQNLLRRGDCFFQTSSLAAYSYLYAGVHVCDHNGYDDPYL